MSPFPKFDFFVLLLMIYLEMLREFMEIFMTKLADAKDVT